MRGLVGSDSKQEDYHARSRARTSRHDILLPTSFYGMAMRGRSVELEGQMNMVGGADDAWIATQILKTVASDGRMRRWQWELVRAAAPIHLR